MRTALVRIVSLLGLVGAFGGGCHDRLYDSGETIDLIDGGTVRVDTGRDQVIGGDAGVGGVTGAGGGATAAGGAAGSNAGTGGAANACDDSSPLPQTDAANRGRRFN